MANSSHTRVLTHFHACGLADATRLSDALLVPRLRACILYQLYHARSCYTYLAATTHPSNDLLARPMHTYGCSSAAAGLTCFALMAKVHDGRTRRTRSLAGRLSGMHSFSCDFRPRRAGPGPRSRCWVDHACRCKYRCLAWEPYVPGRCWSGLSFVPMEKKHPPAVDGVICDTARNNVGCRVLLQLLCLTTQQFLMTRQNHTCVWACASQAIRSCQAFHKFGRLNCFAHRQSPYIMPPQPPPSFPMTLAIVRWYAGNIWGCTHHRPARIL